jgi:ribonucleoside-triphosphate reductase
MQKEESTADLESRRQPCEVYSRVVGYIRPVNQWNDSKQAEFADRLEFAMPEGI